MNSFKLQPFDGGNEKTKTYSFFWHFRLSLGAVGWQEQVAGKETQDVRQQHFIRQGWRSQDRGSAWSLRAWSCWGTVRGRALGSGKSGVGCREKDFGGKTIPAEGKWGAGGLKGSGGAEQGQTLCQATKTEVLVAGRGRRALR